VLDALGAIRSDSLSASDRLNQTLFRRLYQGKLDEHSWGLQYLPITQRTACSQRTKWPS